MLWPLKRQKKNRVKVHVHGLVMDQNQWECQGDGICSHTGLCTYRKDVLRSQVSCSLFKPRSEKEGSCTYIKNAPNPVWAPCFFLAHVLLSCREYNSPSPFQTPQGTTLPEEFPRDPKLLCTAFSLLQISLKNETPRSLQEICLALTTLQGKNSL